MEPSDGETTAGWGAIARSPLGVCFVTFGLIITAEAQVAFAGAFFPQFVGARSARLACAHFPARSTRR